MLPWPQEGGVWGPTCGGWGPTPPDRSGNRIQSKITTTERITDVTTIGTDHQDIAEPDDESAEILDCEQAARACLAHADGLPDGAPEQLGVLLRGQLAAQLGIFQVLTMLATRLHAWPELHSEWHIEHPGQPCGDGICPDRDGWQPLRLRRTTSP